MLPSLSLPPLECCFGTSPIQAEKSRPDRNTFGSAMLATSAVASAGPTPGIASSRLLVSCERNLRFQRMQLGTQSCDTGTCHLRDSFVFRIGEDIEELFEAFAADRRHDAKLGKVGADRVDHRGLLTDEQVPRTMKDQAALLLRRLGLDKPHVGSGDSLADRLGISGIILLSLDIGPDGGRRHQADPMPKRLQFP